MDRTQETATGSAAPWANRAGMTIIELLATMAIVGSLASIAVPKYHALAEAAKVARAIGDIQAIQTTLDTRDSLPNSLASVNQNIIDPWGNPYVYVKFAMGGSPRVDAFGIPINTTYDLYSYGKDGATASPLNASVSLDDVVRANDGGFIGAGNRY